MAWGGAAWGSEVTSSDGLAACKTKSDIEFGLEGDADTEAQDFLRWRRLQRARRAVLEPLIVEVLSAPTPSSSSTNVASSEEHPLYEDDDGDVAHSFLVETPGVAAGLVQLRQLQLHNPPEVRRQREEDLHEWRRTRATEQRAAAAEPSCAQREVQTEHWTEPLIEEIDPAIASRALALPPGLALQQPLYEDEDGDVANNFLVEIRGQPGLVELRGVRRFYETQEVIETRKVSHGTASDNQEPLIQELLHVAHEGDLQFPAPTGPFWEDEDGDLANAFLEECPGIPGLTERKGLREVEPSKAAEIWKSGLRPVATRLTFSSEVDLNVAHDPDDLRQEAFHATRVEPSQQQGDVLVHGSGLEDTPARPKEDFREAQSRGQSKAFVDLLAAPKEEREEDFGGSLQLVVLSCESEKPEVPVAAKPRTKAAQLRSHQRLRRQEEQARMRRHLEEQQIQRLQEERERSERAQLALLSALDESLEAQLQRAAVESQQRDQLEQERPEGSLRQAEFEFQEASLQQARELRKEQKLREVEERRRRHQELLQGRHTAAEADDKVTKVERVVEPRNLRHPEAPARHSGASAIAAVTPRGVPGHEQPRGGDRPVGGAPPVEESQRHPPAPERVPLPVDPEVQKTQSTHPEETKVHKQPSPVFHQQDNRVRLLPEVDANEAPSAKPADPQRVEVQKEEGEPDQNSWSFNEEEEEADILPNNGRESCAAVEVPLSGPEVAPCPVLRPLLREGKTEELRLRDLGALSSGEPEAASGPTQFFKIESDDSEDEPAPAKPKGARRVYFDLSKSTEHFFIGSEPETEEEEEDVWPRDDNDEGDWNFEDRSACEQECLRSEEVRWWGMSDSDPDNVPGDHRGQDTERAKDQSSISSCAVASCPHLAEENCGFADFPLRETIPKPVRFAVLKPSMDSEASNPTVAEKVCASTTVRSEGTTSVLPPPVRPSVPQQHQCTEGRPNMEPSMKAEARALPSPPPAALSGPRNAFFPQDTTAKEEDSNLSGVQSLQKEWRNRITRRKGTFSALAEETAPQACRERLEKQRQGDFNQLQKLGFEVVEV